MNTDNIIGDQIEVVRKETLTVLDRLKEKAHEYSLAQPPAVLEEYRGKLEENNYNVLVVGEMKHGKSSLINAVIGRDILPINVDIATSTVFRVRNVRPEAYRIRFEDNSVRAITLADLPRYGSQQVIDVQGAISLGQLSRWIEVDVPAEFLPENMNILDTPGLGSLYTDHAMITLRFIPQADAVIFVLASEKPMVKLELDYVEHILKYTSNIFFIQTKIDQYGEEHWQLIQRRNQQILAEHFKDALLETTVWPVSSTNLMMAAQTGDEDYLAVSYYKQLELALRAFLFRVAGISRCASTLVTAEHYQLAAKAMLESNIAGLGAKSTQELAGQQDEVAQRQQQFETDWGTRGKKRRDLLTRVHNVANAHRQSFIEFVTTGGKLEVAYRRKIDALKTIDEVNALGAALAGQITTDVMEQWRSVTSDAHLQCTGLFAPFIEAAGAMMGAQEVAEPFMNISVGLTNDINGDVWDKFDKAQANFLKAGGVSANAVLIAWYLFPAVIVPLLPIAFPAVIVAGLWAAIRGWKMTGMSQFKAAQKQLSEHLTTVLNEVHERFLRADLSYEGVSLVSHYFDTLIRTMEEQLEDIAATK